MALTHLLDTSVYCQVLKPAPLETVVARWRGVGDAHLAISAICEAELLYGLALRASPVLNDRYEKFLRGRLALLPVDAGVAEAFALIKARQKRPGRLIPDLDLLVAATAKAHGLIVATLNVAHFRQIKGLSVEDWSRAA